MGQMPLEYLYFAMQIEKYSQVHLEGGAGGEMVSFTLCTLLSVASLFVLHRLHFRHPFSPFFLLFPSLSFSLSAVSFRLVSSFHEACISVFSCHRN